MISFEINASFNVNFVGFLTLKQSIQQTTRPQVINAGINKAVLDSVSWIQLCEWSKRRLAIAI